MGHHVIHANRRRSPLGIPASRPELLAGRETRERLRADRVFRQAAVAVSAILTKSARALFASNPSDGVILDDDCELIGRATPDAVATARRREFAHALHSIASQLRP